MQVIQVYVVYLGLLFFFCFVCFYAFWDVGVLRFDSWIGKIGFFWKKVAPFW